MGRTMSDKKYENSVPPTYIKDGNSSHLAPWVSGIVGRASIRSSPLPTPRKTEHLVNRHPENSTVMCCNSLDSSSDLKQMMQVQYQEKTFATHKQAQLHLNTVWFLRF